MAMDQYLYIPFLGDEHHIYQLILMFTRGIGF